MRPVIEPSSRRGFTLVELMIVVVILGTLATIATARFSDIFVKAREGATKGNLGALRSAISIYYAEMEGQYPATMAALTANSHYMNSIPRADTRAHGGSSLIALLPNDTADDGGGWMYVENMTDANWGRVAVNCTHTDTKGTVWTQY